MNDGPSFILAGNNPYENRGCEAIMRGTVKILRHYYKDPSFLCLSHFQTQEQFEKQCREEFDSAIIHKKTYREKHKIFTYKWFHQVVQRKISEEKHMDNVYRDIYPAIKEAKGVLSIGGDNYSLDYGVPRLFTGLDNLVLKSKKPIFIWGASVGPFDKRPSYERYMSKHLREITGIFARENATIDYLNRLGVQDNVYKVADPAFLLDANEPVTPKKIEIERDSIGINLSPLMSRYINNTNSGSWIDIAADIISEIVEKTNNHIYLIPHVTIPISNDYLFLKEVQTRIIDSNEKVSLIPPIYNASETKWIISQMKLFAGARTHSTIASLSSCIPTLSFAYSLKAKGINKDIFGHYNYCLDADKLNPLDVAEKIESMLDEYSSIKSFLKASIPKIEAEAFSAGKYLKDISDDFADKQDK